MFCKSKFYFRIKKYFLRAAAVSSAVIALTAVSCSFFGFPFPFDNPWDPAYNPGETYSEINVFGKTAFSDREGIASMSDIVISEDRSFLIVSDLHNPKFMRIEVPANTASFIELSNPDIRGLKSIDINGNSEFFAVDDTNLYQIDITTGNTATLVSYKQGFYFHHIAYDRSADVLYTLTDDQAGGTALTSFTTEGVLIETYPSSYFDGAAGLAVSGNFIYVSILTDTVSHVYALDKGAKNYVFGYNSISNNINYTNAAPVDNTVGFLDVYWDWDYEELYLVAYNAVNNYIFAGFSIAGDVDPLGITSLGTYPSGTPADVWDSGGISVCADGTANPDLFGTVPEMGRVVFYDNGTNTFTAVYDRPPLEGGEFIRVSDMEYSYGADSLVIADNASWYWTDISGVVTDYPSVVVHSDLGPDPSLGNTAYPEVIADNGSYIFLKLAGNNLNPYTRSDGIWMGTTTAVDFGITDFAVIQGFADIVAWDPTLPMQFRRWDATGGTSVIGDPLTTFGWNIHNVVVDQSDLDSVIWCAVTTDTGFVVGTLQTDAVPTFTGFTPVLYSDEETWFTDVIDGSVPNMPHRVTEIEADPIDGSLWLVMPEINAAVKLSADGGLVGTLCLDPGFEGGGRWLPGRFFDFAERSYGRDYFDLGGFAIDSIGRVHIFSNEDRQLYTYEFQD